MPVNDKNAVERFTLYSLTVAGVLLAVVIIAYSLDIPGRDSGVYLYMGRYILDGDLPYVDLWDHKPPLIFYIDALGLIIGHGDKWGVHFLEFTLLLGSAVCAWSITKPLFGNGASLFAMLVWITSLPRLLHGGNFTEEFAILSQFAALLVFVRAEAGTYRWHGFMLGVFGALAFLLKQKLIAIWIGLGILFIYQYLRQRSLGCMWRKLLPMIAGTAFTLGLFPLYFYIQGGLDAFWDGAFLYNFQYSNVGWGARFFVMLEGLQKYNIAVVPLAGWLAAVIFLFKTKNQPPALYGLLQLLVIVLPLELLFSSTSGRVYSHYFISYLPVFAVLSGFFSWLLLTYVTKHIYQDKKITTSVAAGILGLIITACIGQYINSVYVSYARITSAGGLRPTVAGYIRSHTAANDYVLLWGAETVVNFLAQRKSPTRYFYQYPLITKNYSNEALVKRFMIDLKQNQPAMIVDTGDTLFPPLERDERMRWSLPRHAMAIGYDLPPRSIEQFYVFVERHYYLASNIQGWKIYVQKNRHLTLN